MACLHAWAHTLECDIVIAYFAVTKFLLNLREKIRVGISSWVTLLQT
jgi:hypothetical protein